MENYPILFEVSDSSAIEARRNHFLLFKVRLLLLLLGAIISITWALFKFVELGIVMCFSLVLLVALRVWDQKGYPKLWYESRAIAESVKEATWLFVMKAERYDIGKEEAEKEFLDRLEEIRDFYGDTSSKLQSRIDAGVQITEEMSDIRNETIDNRKEFYFENRVGNQQGWYTKKASWNQKRKKHWDVFRFFLELSAVGFALLLVSGFWEINIIGILTTAIGLVLSWDQANKHEELHKIYNHTAQSLSFLYARRNLITTESKLSEIVLKAEREISKEHSTWLSRRIT